MTDSLDAARFVVQPRALPHPVNTVSGWVSTVYDLIDTGIEESARAGADHRSTGDQASAQRWADRLNNHAAALEGTQS